jgi:uncharacterized FAD-dependent dehydrogenase
MHKFLADRIESQTDTAAISLIRQNGRIKGIQTDDGQRIESRYLIIAPGREGADWLLKEAARLGLTLHNNPIDVGAGWRCP